MKNLIIATISLCAFLMPISAQEKTPAEESWAVIVAAAKNDPRKAAETQEAFELYQEIIAGDTLSALEAEIVVRVITFRKIDFNALATQIINSNKTGLGVASIKARYKFANSDASDWTDEMIAGRIDLACWTAMKATSPQELTTRIWSYLQINPASNPAARQFFKKQRALADFAQQIKFTENQKQLLLAKGTRSSADNQWLNEVLVDLVAYRVK
jgi:hypothetical protein